MKNPVKEIEQDGDIRLYITQNHRGTNSFQIQDIPKIQLH